MHGYAMHINHARYVTALVTCSAPSTAIFPHVMHLYQHSRMYIRFHGVLQCRYNAHIAFYAVFAKICNSRHFDACAIIGAFPRIVSALQAQKIRMFDYLNAHAFFVYGYDL